MMSKTFAEYYKKVAPERREVLEKFRKHAQYKQLVHNGTTWQYYAAGTGDKILFLIPGGLRKAESIFSELLRFQEHFRVISPNVPLLQDADSILDGLHAILDEEKVRTATLSGRSFGGSLVQGFAAKYPEKVAKLILCSTVYNDASYLQKTEQALKSFQSMSPGFMRVLIRWALLNIIKTDTGQEGKRYWKAYITEFLDSVNVKELMISQLKIGYDMISRYPLTPERAAEFRQNILIIYAKNDSIISKADEAKYVKIFPHAQKKIFARGGHALFQTQEKAYFETLTAFIKEA